MPSEEEKGRGSPVDRGRRTHRSRDRRASRGGAPRIRDLCRLVDEIAPPGLAEPWDNVGLLVGEPETRPKWVAVALDAAHALAVAPPPPGAERAGRLLEGPGLLVTHHPVPLRPLARLTAGDPTAAQVAELIRRGISLYAAHTSFDSAPEGLSHVLAVDLGLEPASLRLLAPAAGQAFYKLVVFVPASHTAAVRAALAEAGAGWIGNYSDASFAARGRGLFRPREGADPFVGTVGEVEEVEEDRLETIVPAYALGAALDRMLAAHPYEEPAYDVYPLRNHPPVTRPELMTGIGRVGELHQETDLGRFRAEAERRLGLEAGTARLLGPAADGAPAVAEVTPAPARAGESGGAPRPAPVRRVAVCPGAGGAYLKEAAAAGADVYVTGDLDYHQTLEACRLGLLVLDCGHLGTEKAFVPVVAGRLRKNFASQGIPLEVIEVPVPSGWLF